MTWCGSHPALIIDGSPGSHIGPLGGANVPAPPLPIEVLFRRVFAACGAALKKITRRPR